MRHRLNKTLFGIALLVGLAAGLGLASCFAPEYHDCAFRCGPESPACPAEYDCLADGYCHRKDSAATCPFTMPAPDMTAASPRDLAGADLYGLD